MGEKKKWLIKRDSIYFAGWFFVGGLIPTPVFTDDRDKVVKFNTKQDAFVETTLHSDLEGLEIIKEAHERC